MNEKINYVFTDTIIVSVILKATLVIGYDMTCPTDGHWYLRSLKCTPNYSYVCLFDDINEKYVENCDGKKEVGKGYKCVIRQNIDRESCAVNMYQPFKFTTYKQSHCVYQKSLCSEEGQISTNNGSAITDRACRCDYRKGYAFILEPQNKCFCLPGVEDCSCFIKICNGKHNKLSPDYECSEGEMTVCSPINDDLTGNTSFQINKSEEAANKALQSFHDSLGFANKTTVLIMCFMITPVIFFMVEKLLICCFRKHLKDVYCIEGETAEFEISCVPECMNEPPTWFKNNKKLQQSNNIMFISKVCTHKLVIKKTAKDDRGLYSVEIGQWKSRASLISIDRFQKHLEDVNFMEGESVTFICETKCMDERPTWFRNNDKLQPSTHIMLSSEGCTHKLLINKASKDDKGVYSVKIGQSESQASLKITDRFQKHLEDVNCMEGESVTFICETKCMDERPTWFRYNDKLQQSTHIMFSSEGCTHKLLINKASKDDRGLYSIKMGQSESQASLIITDIITTEEISYLRIVHLIIKMAVPAVRIIFNEEFHPDTLEKTIQTNIGKLKELKGKNYINGTQWMLLFKKGNELSSENFDLRLMICLLRNFAGYNIIEKLPVATNDSKDADLTRIKYYRNRMAHSQGTLSNDHFKSYWKDLSEAAKRLSEDIYQQYVDKSSIPDVINSADVISKALLVAIRNDDDNTRRNTRKMSTEEIAYLRIVHLLHSVACHAVRAKFNSLIEPSALPQYLKENREIFKDMKNKRYYEALYPAEGTPSSRRFEMNLMLRIMWESRNKEKESIWLQITESEYEAVSYLQSYLHRIAESKTGSLSEDTFSNDWMNICKRVITLGGKKFIARCSYLNPKCEDYVKTLV